MKVHVKYDVNFICRTVLEEQLIKLNINYSLIGLGEVEIQGDLGLVEKNELSLALKKYGIQIIDDQKEELVQRIKDAITEMITGGKETRLYKVSAYLSEKLEYSYPYLSNLFSEATHSSIENFIIMKKIDLAKTLILNDQSSLTEIAHQLNYSSVAHLSYQFKKTTGLTPSAFQKIIRRRKEKNLGRNQ
ncbi:AraC family transcriptional regulator [Flavobacteriaceae bacterium F89]|uniref:AraC family transcriptional regulator n=1 Tax=Cerina litoralis TaxID=2874477 RepID=A0AAE3EYH3_9FLAO|nr:AraC family transcriptional regulator [Cerina litoralis]MCG2462037.1 AraC family transcriptional regulator [Cerina litoralis]